MIKSAPLAIRNNNDVLFLRKGALLDQSVEYIRNPELEYQYRTGQIHKGGIMKDKKMVIVNQGEKDDEIAAKLADAYDVSRQPLDIGTLWAFDENGSLIIVDVISAKDFRASIYTGDIVRTSQQMIDLTSLSYIIINGEIDHDNTIDNSIISLQEFGLIVTYADEYSILETRISYIINKKRDPKRVEPLRQMIVSTPGEMLLMSIPGIGPSKVAVLLNQCGTIAWALAALTDPSVRIDHITDKDKESARMVCELEDGEMLAVIGVADRRDENE